MSLLQKRINYKPFQYPWADSYWQSQQQIHWLPEEVPLQEDVTDWKHRLNDGERNLLTQIFRFFTTADVDVANGYMNYYLPALGGHPEVASMLLSFANMETIHIKAYSLLLDTVGMPEVEYGAFANYAEMKNKHDYMLKMNTDTVADILRTIAIYSAFGEGMQLFSSFAILLNFPRFGKMKGMGQIVTWSIRDESLHVEGMLHLFEALVRENPDVWTDELKKEIYDAARKMVELEDAFIDLAFGVTEIEGLDKDDLKRYIRYTADKRLLQMGLKTEFKVKENPLPWLEEILNAQKHVNFFEQRVTEYQKSATLGDWNEKVWNNAEHEQRDKRNIRHPYAGAGG